MKMIKLFFWIIFFGSPLFSLNVNANIIGGDNKLGPKSNFLFDESGINLTDHVTLMIAKKGVSFRHKLNEETLEQVSCIYETNSTDLIGLLLSIMKDSIIYNNKGQKVKIDIRVGMIFIKKDNILGKAFFEDWGGTREVNGIFADFMVLGVPNFPDQLRTWARTVGVSRVENGVQGCD